MNSSIPVHLNEPYDLQTLIDATRSVKEGIVLYNHQFYVLMRSRLSEAQNNRCCWCGCRLGERIEKSDSPTIEHVIPRSMGGSDDESNFAVACLRCNKRRKTKSVKEYMIVIEKTG